MENRTPVPESPTMAHEEDRLAALAALAILDTPRQHHAKS